MARLRTIGRRSAIITGGVLAISGIAAGTAFAHEEASDGFTPTSPVDGVANHWMMYHYKEESFATDEAERISSDPKRYADIHGDMAKEMLGGSAAHKEGMGYGDKGSKSEKGSKSDKGKSEKGKKSGNSYGGGGGY